MRTRSGRLNADTMQRIGDMYDRLNNACVNGVRDYGCFDSRDLFHDTMIEVSRENLGPMTDTEFIGHFCYKFREVRFQLIKDNRERYDAKTAKEKGLLF